MNNTRMFPVKPLAFLALVAALVLPASAFAETKPLIRIAAVVNDEVITTLDLEKEMRPFLADLRKSGKTISSVDREALERKTLDGMVELALFRQRAKELGMEVTEAEIDQAVDDVLAQNNIPLEKLQAALDAEGIPFDEYRKNLGNQILRLKLVGREVRSKVDVTKHEIRTWYDENKEEYRLPGGVHLLRFTINPRPTDDPVAALEAMEKARTAWAAGATMEKLREEYGAVWDVDAVDMGTLDVNGLSPVFADEITGLPKGGVTTVLQIGGSLHLLQVADTVAARYTPLEDVEEEIRKMLLDKNAEKRLKEWQDELRSQAFVDIKL